MKAKEVIVEIAKANIIVPFDQSVDFIAKGRRVNFKYASLPQINKTIRPVLATYDAALYTLVETVWDDAGMPTDMVIIKVVLEADDIKESSIPMRVTGMDMKEVGARLTYYKRYLIASLLNLIIEEDVGEMFELDGATRQVIDHRADAEQKHRKAPATAPAHKETKEKKQDAPVKTTGTFKQPSNAITFEQIQKEINPQLKDLFRQLRYTTAKIVAMWKKYDGNQAEMIRILEKYL